MRPRYSIVIPFYNGFPHIEQCVRSVLSQGVGPIEVIVVDDRDPQDSGAALEGLYRDEQRVKVIRHERNLGTLQARRTGVLASTGEHVMLLDDDDSLATGALAAIDAELDAHPVDILHFGVVVIAENESAEQAREGMSRFVNPPVREVRGHDILRRQFAMDAGFDWQVHHKVYDGDLARKVWGMLGDVRLSYADDVLESFATCCFAKTYRAVDGAWYEYHLGRGSTFGEAYDLSSFERWCTGDAQAYAAVEAFAGEHAGELQRADMGERIADVRDQLVSHTMNEMVDKLGLADRAAEIEFALVAWPADAVAGELWRFVRDRAYALYDTGQRFGAEDALLRLFDDAARVDALVDSATGGADTGSGSARYREMREAAIRHINDLQLRTGFAPSAELEHIRRWLRQEVQPIRIFATTHKDVDLFDSSILQPVQVGPVEGRSRFAWAYQDDMGESIASLNPMFCELATQYWAWKNVDAQYYGFCHYRRYFDFSSEQHKENPWGEVVCGRIDRAAQERYRLDDASIANAVEGCDIITTRVVDVSGFPGAFRNVREHYRWGNHLRVEHLDRIVQILKEEHPDYAEDADAFLAGSTACFCNMFVMRRELFFRYCEWLFPMLQRFVGEWDASTLSHEGLRTPGHLAERLFNIWLAHEKRVNPGLAHKQVQCVHFGFPDRTYPQRLGAACGAGKPVVPVVFAADDAYVPMLATTICSMLENASPESFYDIVVLEKDFSAASKSDMLEFFSRYGNAQLRFANVASMIAEYDLRTSNDHISIETYYRFLVQNVLPEYDKVLYLDADLIIEDDVSQLFATELGGNLLAAVRDIDFLGNLNMSDGWRMDYARNVLRMSDPYGYFQAGVLLLNLAEMRKLHAIGEWLQIASEAEYIYDDQDILNSCCEGRVLYLDNAWNVMIDCEGRIGSVFSFAPADVFDEFMAAYTEPKIIHYAGCEKPWKPGHCDMAVQYWRYARQTPFYEQLLEMKCTPVDESVAEKPVDPPDPFDDGHESCISENSPLRALDPVLPMGTRRREVAKAAMRFVRRRK